MELFIQFFHFIHFAKYFGICTCHLEHSVFSSLVKTILEHLALVSLSVCVTALWQHFVMYFSSCILTLSIELM